jgi:hypothetical protein
MMNPMEEDPVVYVAVPMKDETAVPSAPAIFVPSTAVRRRPNNRAVRVFFKAVVLLFVGFVVTTLCFMVAPPLRMHHSKPCFGLRGAHHRFHGMNPHHGMEQSHHDMHHNPEVHGRQGHPGDHIMIHDMMHHGMNQHKHSSGDVKRHWKNSHDSSSSQDGWYAGNTSHDGWHVSMYEDTADDRVDTVDVPEQDVDQNMHLEAVERVEFVKEDGMVPGLP